MRSLRWMALLTLILVVAACGDDADGITIEGAWARNSAAMQTAGAAYLVITSPVDDALVSASVDASIAAVAELHEVVMADTTDTTMGDMSTTTMGGMSDTTMGGMMMREVAQIELFAGEAVSLAPGGYHIMLMELVAPLEIGQTFDLILGFENAADIVVTVEVREEAP